MSARPCAACGCSDVRPRSRDGYYARTSCPRCGLLSIVDEAAVDDLSVEQSEAEYVASYSGTLERVCNRRLALVRSIAPPPATVLDFGAGFGFIAERLQAAGYSVTPLEISPNALASMRRRGLHPVADLDEIGPKTFDIVTIWHVLEHVDRPHDLLVRLRPLLSSTGTAVAAVPNAAGAFARASLDHWIWTLPWHLHYFDRRSIRELFERSGYVVKTSTTGPGDVAALECLVGELLLRRPSRFKIWDLAKRRAPQQASVARAAAAGVLRPLSWAVQECATRLGAGEELIIQAKRRKNG